MNAHAIDEDDTDEGVVPVGEDVLPGYDVVELLSRGQRVDTYDVHSRERGCRCIVKIVRPDRADVERVREAVLTEGRLLTDLTHPHLVRGYEVVEQPVPAAVLETLGGHTLDALVARRRLGPRDAAHLGLQLGSALSYLHRHGWLHLDVKPENVVVDGTRAVLIDLSVARQPGPARAGIGTEEYMAPEQLSGGVLTAATDTFGLGVTLLEAMTDRLPDPARALPYRVGRRPLRPWGEPLPPAFGDLLRRCLHPDPARRPGWPELRRVLTAVAETS
ncbi:serine/threonine-protein kinase [Nocardioides nanhaiensis]|uniref:Protein kinase domain-containing protein n=1 Tax=Nocardioides nanhaiensis TaxID=1476871 RepID=A0ABP8WSP3_9ACTN